MNTATHNNFEMDKTSTKQHLLNVMIEAKQSETKATSQYCAFPSYIVYDLTLSKEAKVLYVLLCQYASKNGYAYASQKKLAKDLNMGENISRIRSLTHELEQQGYITVERKKKSADGKISVNIYRLVDRPQKFFGKPPHCPYEYHEKAYEKVRENGLKGNGFGFVSATLLKNKELHITSKFIAIYLAALAGNKGCAWVRTEKICFHGVKPLKDGNRQNMGVETYQRYAKELTDFGELERVQRREGGRFNGNLFNLPKTPVKTEKAFTAFNNFFLFAPHRTPSSRSMVNGTQASHTQDSDCTNTKNANTKNFNNNPMSSIKNSPTLDIMETVSYTVSALDVSLLLKKFQEHEEYYAVEPCTIDEAKNKTSNVDYFDYACYEFFKTAKQLVKNGSNTHSKEEIVRAFGEMLSQNLLDEFLNSICDRYDEQIFEVKNHAAYIKTCIETALFTPDYGIDYALE